MGQASARAKNEPSAPAYYEWKPAGSPLTIHLSFAVIDQIESDIMKGFWSVPKRGAEVGGVLFGRIAASGDTTAVFIDDYEPVVCEYRRGPSYVLSEADRKRLDRALRKGDGERQVVGFYRSHTRLGLYLDQDDFALLQSYFANPNCVVLLVRPHAAKTSVGGFFFWEEGNIHRQSTYQEFPFSSAEIQKSLPQPAPAATASTTPPQPAAATARPASAPAPPRLRLPGRIRVPASILPGAAIALVALVAILAGYNILGSRAAKRAANNDALPALSIQRNGAYLQVDWNRNAPSVVNAQRGVLLITDGNRRRELHLDSRELRSGSVAYSPLTGDVRFRLDLLGGRTPVSASLRVVDGTRRPRLATAAREPARAAARTPAPAPAAAVVEAAHAPAPAATPSRQARIPRQHAFFDDGL